MVRLSLTSKTREHLSIIPKRRIRKLLGHDFRMTSDLTVKTALTWTLKGKRKEGTPKNNMERKWKKNRRLLG